MRTFDHVADTNHADLVLLPGAAGADPWTEPPSPLTTFVGRGADLAAVAELLDRHRLVTITGPGGCGKTRLALELASAWPSPTRWTDLDATGVPATRPDERHALVCLDTCDDVLEPVARMVAGLLRDRPDLTVLATSREPLGVPGEVVRRIAPLDAADAVALFEHRAALTAGGPAGHDQDVVARICRRLDGLPLAIELAAAWTATLSAEELADRLPDRGRLLVDGRWGVPARHRTLAASVAWSLDRLGPADRRLLRELAVFPGGFTAAAAVAVCGDGALAGIRRLVDRSLVVRDEQFRLLGTVREVVAREAGGSGSARAVRPRPGGPAGLGFGALSPAQRTVAALVADGCTNPEIGRRLFMSRSTVKTHLEHAYAKLGIHTRAELAAIVARETST